MDMTTASLKKEEMAYPFLQRGTGTSPRMLSGENDCQLVRGKLLAAGIGYGNHWRRKGLIAAKGTNLSSVLPITGNTW
jgi:hypothetical protein